MSLLPKQLPLPLLKLSTSIPSRPFHTTTSLLSTNPAVKPSGKQSYQPTPAGPAPTGRKDGLSVWPFLFIFVAGTGLFALTVKSREGSYKQKGTTPAGDQYSLKKPKNQQNPISH